MNECAQFFPTCHRSNGYGPRDMQYVSLATVQRRPPGERWPSWVRSPVVGMNPQSKCESGMQGLSTIVQVDSESLWPTMSILRLTAYIQPQRALKAGDSFVQPSPRSILDSTRVHAIGENIYTDITMNSLGLVGVACPVATSFFFSLRKLFLRSSFLPGGVMILLCMRLKAR